MQLSFPRFRRALPLLSGQWLRAIELMLVAGLGVQGARIAWELVTPVGSFGEWRPRPVVELAPRARAALFAGFDPFYRSAPAQAATQNVTALSLQLFGTRVNQASGGGSAIIAGPDGVQASYAVGDEIVSGVTLKAVEVDHVVLSHGGTDELLFLDQSTPAPVAQPSGQPPLPGIAPPPASGAEPLSGERLRNEIGFAPRAGNGGVTGVAVSPNGAAFAQAGFRAGDVIVGVNGRPVRSAGDIQSLSQALVPGARLSLQVERGANIIPIALVLPN